MIVSGRRMKAFVNDAVSPTLEVGRLDVMSQTLPAYAVRETRVVFNSGR